MLDRDMNSKWNQYLKKYTNDYVLDIREGITTIRLKKKIGWIEPYSIQKKQLVAVLSFRSQQHKTYFKKKLIRNEGFGLKITQEGIDELCVRFPEKYIKNLKPLFSYYERKKLSEEERKKINERLKKARVAR